MLKRGARMTNSHQVKPDTIGRPSPGSHPDDLAVHTRVPLTSPQRWAAVGAVACALTFILIGLYRAGVIPLPKQHGSKVDSTALALLTIGALPLRSIVPMARHRTLSRVYV